MRAYLLAAVLAAALPGWVAAADHALIMGIGVYQRADANLPGIDKDVEIARRIAQSIGVPTQNIRQLSDREVTREGVHAALRQIESKVQPGDRVFIYYSGHGAQEQGSDGAQCTEGMFVHDMQMVPDGELESALGRIAARTSQVIMFNDSCFSGGAANKATTRSVGAVPKFFKAVADRPNYTCGQAVNMKSGVRNLIASAASGGAGRRASPDPTGLRRRRSGHGHPQRQRRNPRLGRVPAQSRCRHECQRRSGRQ